MRICVFSERMAEPFDEGIKSYTAHLIGELGKAHEVMALTTFGDSIPALGIENVRANKLLLSITLARKVRGFRPEMILYVPTACATPFSFLRARVLKAYGQGAVALVALQVRSYGLLARLVMPHLRPDLALVQSERTRAALEPLGCRLRLVPPGIDLERFRPAVPGGRAQFRRAYGIAPESYVILHVGHLNRGRNVQALIPLQQQPGNQVVVVGSTSTPQDEGLVQELIQAGVKVIGKFVNDIAEVYQMADCYVFPVSGKTSAIDLPLSVLEAMACNLPVVSTPFGGLPGQLGFGRGLRYVEDSSRLAEAVEACKGLADPGTREMVKPFAWPSVIPAILEGICDDLGLKRPDSARG